MKVIHQLLVASLAVLVLVLTSASAVAQPPDIVGQWDFNSGDLSPTAGNALEYIGDTQSRTVFGNTTSLGIPNIDGVVANVMCFPTNAIGQGYSIDLFGSQANGGGSLVNEWTIVFDLLFPTASANKFRALMETDGRVVSPDADLMIDSNGGIGGNSDFDGSMQANTWYRVAFVVDTPNNIIRKYINGAMVGTQSATHGSGQALDGRWALSPGGTAELFNDDDGQTAPGYVNCIQLRDVALSSLQVRALGGPSAAGVPQVIPPIPSFVDSWIPAGPYAYNVTTVGAVIHDGDTDITDGSITLRLDSVVQSSPVITRNGDLISVTKVVAALPVATKHVVQIDYTDSLNGAMVFSNQFEVAVFLEDFNSLTLGPNVDEGLAGTTVWTSNAPPGWVIEDWMSDAAGVQTPIDPANDGVTEWAGWSFADAVWWATTAGNQNRVNFTKATGAIAVFDPDEWDDLGHAAGMLNSSLTTPNISLAGAAANTVVMRLDTSWRDECCDDNAGLTNDQSFIITASYDGGPEQVLLHWSSNPADPSFHDDDENGTQIIQLNNPAGASNLKLKFLGLYSENDWWVAFDNLLLTASILPPTITTQPQSDLVSAGSSPTVTVRASSQAALTYQWLFNDAILTGQTSSNLTLVNFQQANVGNYRAIVSNSAGSVTSQVARLEIFSGTVTQDLVVHLKFDGDFNDASGRGNNAAGGVTGTPTFVAGGRIGQAMHIQTNDVDAGFQPFATLGAPPDLNFGTSTDFSVSFWARIVRWNGDPSLIANKDWDDGGNPGWVIFTSDGQLGLNLAGPPGARKDAGVATGGLGTGGNGDNVWHHCAITFDRTGPASFYFDGVKRGTLDLGVSQNNLDTPVGFATNIGQDGAGDYGPKFQHADFDDVGMWRRIITPQEVASIYGQGLLGQDLTTATGNPPLVPPAITTQPQSRTVYAGFPTTFTVGASGTPPLTYQWRKNSSNIPGQTSSSLVINNAQESDEGSYDVIVSNSANSVTSNPAILTVDPAPPALVTGQWDFNQSNLVATIGQDLAYFNATIQADTSFGTTTSFGIPNIAGAPATVLYFSPSTASWGGYIMHHGANPNLGTYVNLYTIIYDVLYPPASDGQWRSFLQTSTANANDGDFFVNTANGIGISGNYQGSVSANVWHRIALVVNLSVPRVSKYLDGVNVGNQTLGEGIDGRWSLDPFALLFGDEDGDQHATYVNSIQFRNWVMTDAEIAALGTPTAGGIPAPLTITGVNVSGPSITVAGGTAPYTLQRKADLSEAEWTDIVTTNSTTIVVPVNTQNGFFRVVSRVVFNVTLNGANERPPISPAGTASGTVTLDGRLVTANITYSGMTSTVINAHIHGPASTEVSAGVLQGLTFSGGTSGTVTGGGVLSGVNVQRLLDGLTYVNIHTVNNSGGEIRGQLILTP